MKNLFIVLIIFSLKFLFADSIYVSPGLFSSIGDYTNGTKSNSYSFYNTTYFDKYYLTLGVDMHKLSGSGWKYDQFNYAANLFINEYPVFYKLSYMFIDGKSIVDVAGANSQTNGNLFNFEYLLYKDGFYIGGAATFFSQSGSSKEKSVQFTPRFEYIYSSDIQLSIKPNYFLSSVGSSLFSTQVGISYSLLDNLFLSGSASLGNRKYYFNNDLLTIFNQTETQNLTYTFRADYVLTPSLRLIGSYTRSGFEGYDINYFSVGIKTGFWIF